MFYLVIYFPSRLNCLPVKVLSSITDLITYLWIILQKSFFSYLVVLTPIKCFIMLSPFLLGTKPKILKAQPSNDMVVLKQLLVVSVHILLRNWFVKQSKLGVVVLLVFFSVWIIILSSTRLERNIFA